MPINWEDVKSFGAGTINDMLFDLPEVIAKATGKNIFEEMRQRNPTAYELGKTASIVGGLIPGGALIKGLKGLKTADTAMDTLKGVDRFADIAKTGKGMDTVLDAARAADEVADIAKSAKKADTAADFMKGVKSFEKVDDSERIISPRVKKLLENIERAPEVAKKAEKVEDYTNIAKKAYESNKVPKGWFVHGRKGRSDIETNFVKQMTTDMDVAKGYAGEGGSIWLIKPNKNTKVLDFTSQNTKDMNKFIESIKSRYAPRDFLVKYNYLGSVRNPNSWDEIEPMIRGEFTPKNIVSSAQAFDDSDMINMLENYPGGMPDFIKTPDGAILMPGAEKKVSTSNFSIAKPKQIEKIRMRSSGVGSTPDKIQYNMSNNESIEVKKDIAKALGGFSKMGDIIADYLNKGDLAGLNKLIGGA